MVQFVNHSLDLGVTLTSETARGLSDGELVAAATRGDARAFGELFARHRGRVFAAAYGVLKNDAEAEEVTQETFLTAMEKLDGFRQEAAFTTWLHRVAINTALMRRRKKRPLAAGDLSALSERLEALSQPADTHLFTGGRMHSPDDALEASQLVKALDIAFGELPADARDVLSMRAFDELPNAEIAQTLNTSVSAIKSRLHRARVQMKKALAPHLRQP